MTDPTRKLFRRKESECCGDIPLGAAGAVASTGDPRLDALLVILGVAAAGLGVALERMGKVDVAAKVREWVGMDVAHEWVTGNNLPTQADIAAIQEALASKAFADAQAAFQQGTAADLAQGLSFTRYIPEPGGANIPIDGVDDVIPGWITMEPNAEGLEVINGLISKLLAANTSKENMCRVICAIMAGLKNQYGDSVYRPRVAPSNKTPGLPFAPRTLGAQWQRLQVWAHWFKCNCDGEGPIPA